MATGDQTDIYTRLRRVLVPWFGADATISPKISALLQGFASAFSGIYLLIAFARLQARIATSTGGWLELSAYDYLGAGFGRFVGETDTLYSLRIRREILRDRVTRPAIVQAVKDLVGATPTIFEPFSTIDCGGYGGAGLAYGRAGLYGSRAAPYEVWVTTPYPQGYGVPNRGGWGSGTGGYGAGNFSFLDDTLAVGSGATWIDVLAALERVRAAGVTIYVTFTF
jgi:hypothetical protein